MPEHTADTPAAGAGLLSVETPEAVSFSYELADVGSRGLALLLDMLLVGAVMSGEVALVAVVSWGLGRLWPSVSSPLTPWIVGGLIAALFLTFWGYFVLPEGTRGRTPGKRALRLRVMRDDGGRATVLDAFVRNALRLVDMLPGYYAVGLVAALLSAKHKRLGDMAAGTVVVRDPGEEALYSDGRPGTERVALVREFIARRADMTPEGRYQVAAALLAAFGESPGSWDEPTIAGRLADLAGAR
ncbi:MAG: RDD family protein [Coriobacteriia bacterium]|nr:RDD family protein [Coriobacteriia bacterium]